MRNKWTWIITGCFLLGVLSGCSQRSSPSEGEPSFRPAKDVPAVSTVATEDTETPDPPVTTLEEASPKIETSTPAPAIIDTPTQTDEEDNVSQEADNAPLPEPAWQLKVELAKQDLARRLDVDKDEITLLEARQIVWPNGSLGCPQPGMVYTQALVNGLLIRLGVGGRMYFYHSGGSTDPFLCEQTSQVIPKATPKFDEFVPPPDSEID